MRLGIDLDGVVADFNGGWIARYNEEFGADIPPDAVEQWNGPQVLTHFPDMDAFWVWARDHREGGLFRHLDTYEDALPALRRLAGDGHEVVIVTAKPDWAVADTFAWIGEREIPTREVHVTWRKWEVPCDVYLEDAPHQLRRIHRARPEALVCRFVRPWNDPIPGVRDVRSWDDFVGLVDGLDEAPAPNMADR